MFAIIANLLKIIGNALRLLGQFFTILFLGLLAALLMALPWLLRMACVLAWLIGASLAIVTIQQLYSPFSPSGAVIVLQFAVVFLMVAWAGVLLRKYRKNIWGGLAVGGLTSALVTLKGIPWLMANWQHTDLLLRVLPSALFSLALLYLTIRLRILRKRP